MVVRISSPKRAPCPSGVNTMLIVQLASEATLLPQLLLWMKSPVTARLVMLIACPPLLVSVTTWLGVAPPKMTLPKPIAVELRLTIARGARMPLPVSAMVLTIAAFWALLVRLICATLAPVAVGAKPMVRVQLPAGAMLAQPPCPLRVKLAALVPVRVMALRVSGAVPVLPMAMVWLPLLVLMIWSPKATLLPALMIGTGTGTPVPLRLAVCGLPAALSMMLMSAVWAPRPVGLKATPIWQLLPGASETPQSGGAAASRLTRLKGAPTLMPLKSRLAKPVLVTVTLCVLLVVLMIWAGKVSADGAMLMPGTATPLPVPDRPMLCGEPGALLTMRMLPVSAAAVSGVKVTKMLQLPAGASGGVRRGQVLVKPKSPRPVMLEMTRLAPPLLVRVTPVGGLVVLTVRAPKLIVGGGQGDAG